MEPEYDTCSIYYSETSSTTSSNDEEEWDIDIMEDEEEEVPFTVKIHRFSSVGTEAEIVFCIGFVNGFDELYKGVVPIQETVLKTIETAWRQVRASIFHDYETWGRYSMINVH